MTYVQKKGGEETRKMETRMEGEKERIHRV